MFEWVYCVAHAVWLRRRQEDGDPGDPEACGTLGEALERVGASTSELSL